MALTIGCSSFTRFVRPSVLVLSDALALTRIHIDLCGPPAAISSSNVMAGLPLFQTPEQAHQLIVYNRFFTVLVFDCLHNCKVILLTTRNSEGTLSSLTDNSCRFQGALES